MKAQEFFRALTDHLRDSASVRTVFGEPISAEGRTVIPVARVAYGFGGGGGRGTETPSGSNGPANGEDESDDRESHGEGGGGGGGMFAGPAGVVEISASGTRFIPNPEPRRLAAVFLAGLLVGTLLRHPRR